MIKYIDFELIPEKVRDDPAFLLSRHSDFVGSQSSRSLILPVSFTINYGHAKR